MIIVDETKNHDIPADIKVPLETPPPYSPGSSEAGPSSPSSISPVVFGSASNCMSIIKKDGSLKGSWVVDTGLKIPEFLLGPLPKGVEERSDLYLEARDGSISADIKIVGAHAERATLQVISRDGSVKVNIHDRSEQKFFLRAFSADGSIHLRIPRDFIGLIRHRNGDGSTIFSPAILPHVVTFHSHKKDRLSFIGDFTSSGYGDGADWKGDEIDVESKDGHIKLYFIDEPQVPRQGFFDRLFGK